MLINDGFQRTSWVRRRIRLGSTSHLTLRIAFPFYRFILLQRSIHFSRCSTFCVWLHRCQSWCMWRVLVRTSRSFLYFQAISICLTVGHLQRSCHSFKPRHIPQLLTDRQSFIVSFPSLLASINRPSYSCMLRYLASEWKGGWWWLSFDRKLSSVHVTWYVWKHGHLQPRFHSRSRYLVHNCAVVYW